MKNGIRQDDEIEDVCNIYGSPRHTSSRWRNDKKGVSNGIFFVLWIVKVWLSSAYILYTFVYFLYTMAHILLVEDNPTIGKNIALYLEHEAHTVDRFTDGSEWRDRALHYVYDIIILDIMLPGLDGISLLRELREKKQVPVIMTTAKGQIEDKQEAFDLGADDYLVKPFALEELSMRVKALIKRSESRDIYQIGDLQVDVEDKKVILAGTEVHLTIKEFLILAYLLQSNGHAVSRSDLLEFVRWGDALYEHDSKLDVYIANLRKKLGKELIVTIKWFGYKLGV